MYFYWLKIILKNTVAYILTLIKNICPETCKMFRLDSLTLSSPKPEPFFSFLAFYVFSFLFFPFLLLFFSFLLFFLFLYLTERRNCLFVHEGALKSIGLTRDAQQFPHSTDTRLILQSFEWWGAQIPPPPPSTLLTIQTSVNFRIFAELYLRSLRLYHL